MNAPWLTLSVTAAGTLPPELGNYDSGLQLSVFDNNISGQVPASYAAWPSATFFNVNSPLPSWLAAGYNPLLYGPWPTGLTPMGYIPPLTGQSGGTGNNANWPAASISRPAAPLGYFPCDPYYCNGPGTPYSGNGNYFHWQSDYIGTGGPPNNNWVSGSFYSSGQARTAARVCNSACVLR